jgi:hypothetical protein
MNKKKSLLKIYKSQLVQHDYVDFMVSMNRLRAYTLDKKVMYAEGFYAYGNAYTESTLLSFYGQGEAPLVKGKIHF